MSTTNRFGRLALAAAAAALGAGVPTNAGPAAAHSGDDIIIQFTTGGGLTGPCCTFWDMPEITVFADGRAVIVEHVDGRVPRFMSASLAPGGIEALLADVRSAGLLEPEVDAGPICCDLAYTRVLLLDIDPDALVEIQVMGLGFEREDAELTEAQLEVRRVLIELQDGIRDLMADGIASGWYQPEELAVAVQPARPPDDESQPWPLARSLFESDSPDAQGEQCQRVTGSDVATVLDAVGAAESPSWTSDGEEWAVYVRLLLPHESGCPESVARSRQRGELAAHVENWNEAGIADYQLVVAQHCFCPTEFTEPRTVIVRGGEVESVDPELPEGFVMALTVDELFELVEEGLDGAASVSVTYDDEFGFPTSVSLDWDQMMMDEESSYVITDFHTI